MRIIESKSQDWPGGQVGETTHWPRKAAGASRVGSGVSWVSCCLPRPRPFPLRHCCWALAKNVTLCSRPGGWRWEPLLEDFHEGLALHPNRFELHLDQLGAGIVAELLQGPVTDESLRIPHPYSQEERHGRLVLLHQFSRAVEPYEHSWCPYAGLQNRQEASKLRIRQRRLIRRLQLLLVVVPPR